MSSRSPLQPIHTTVWGPATREAAPAVFVHGVFCWGDDEMGFASQRPLAEHYQLRLVDRRGYGRSPDVEQSDYTVDAADVVEQLGDGAHLVGHSYGGVVAILAAALAPDRIRSLTLIEPAAFQAAVEDPHIADLVHRAKSMVSIGRRDIDPESYMRASSEPIGLPVPELTPMRLRASATAANEHSAALAPIPIEMLRAAPWPKLMIRGTWATAPEPYLRLVGRALIACADIVAPKIGAELFVVDGAAHGPQYEQPDVVNAKLLQFWSQADRLRGQQVP